MLKPQVREPIYLTKLKKKEKTMSLYLHTKENMEYDLQAHQEPLTTKERIMQSEKENKKIHQPYPTFLGIRTQSQGIQVLSNREIKPNQPISQDRSLRDKQHRNNVCSSLRFSQSNYMSKESAILYQPQLIHLKARAVNTINSTKAYALKETSPPVTMEGASHKNEQSRFYYEKRINQLQQLNQQANDRIMYLQARLKIQEGVAQRVEKVEKDLSILYEENQQLQKINESLSKPLCEVNEIDIQTQFFPVYVQDAFCQTKAFEIQKAKGPQILQLERQRISLLNRQKEYKITIENIRIENRQAYDRLRDQMDSLAMKYEGKCLQVKQKQSLINRYLINK